MLKYKSLAVAFSYPEGDFFTVFPKLSCRRRELALEYDRLFRTGEVWLYGAEYASRNEFQRSYYLSDITGFYKAFGLETEKDRPDALASEFEFMHYLIFKELRASEKKDADRLDKIFVCRDAQKEFFKEYVKPAASKAARKIIAKTTNEFYSAIAKDTLDFLQTEESILSN